MIIRYVTPEDNPLEISNVYEQSWKYAYRNIIPQSYLNSIPTGKWADSINKNGMSSLVLIEKNPIVGTSSFCKSRWNEFDGFGEIVSIYLLPKFMGKGYGKLLLSKAIDELKKLGFENILLWVLEDNMNARNFYEKNGFVCSEKYLENNIGGKNLREIMYIYHVE